MRINKSKVLFIMTIYDISEYQIFSVKMPSFNDLILQITELLTVKPIDFDALKPCLASIGNINVIKSIKIGEVLKSAYEDDKLTDIQVAQLISGLTDDFSKLAKCFIKEPYRFCLSEIALQSILKIDSVEFDKKKEGMIELLTKVLFVDEAVLIDLIDKIPKSKEGDKLFGLMMELAVVNKEFNLLDKLKSYDADLFEYYESSFFAEDDFERPRAPMHASKYMKQFSNGFGHIDYEGGLLVLAKTKSIKADRYKFNPTLIKDEFEWRIFLETIKDNKGLLLGKSFNFSLAGTHWQTGTIYIEQDGTASLLIIDSLGLNSNGSLTGDYVAADSFKELFSSSEVHVASRTRQNGLKGCSVYALDDLRHLFTEDRYLPNVSDGEFSMLEYVRSHPASDFTSSDGQACYLPNRYLRAAQTSKYKRQMEAQSSEERLSIAKEAELGVPESKWVANKDGESNYVSMSKHFEFDAACSSSDLVVQSPVYQRCLSV